MRKTGTAIVRFTSGRRRIDLDVQRELIRDSGEFEDAGIFLTFAAHSHEELWAFVAEVATYYADLQMTLVSGEILTHVTYAVKQYFHVNGQRPARLA